MIQREGPASPNAGPKGTTGRKSDTSVRRSADDRRRELRNRLVAVADRLEETDPGVAELATLLADDLDDRPDRSSCWTCGSLDYAARERLADCSTVCPVAARHG
ncbi:hypothetical protein [Tenggerimyces flavus]|uniref:Uncharacterized protein n=1 Tax=Tenggerimyces flavus TaxID=1708749 RepID=A0ABV7YNZ1_9ACTN|nr:hypothetical protein [Tenggerimyces flavus]MBM7787778.1 hypothetical protein [Tenggerimyces flavus]